MLFPSLACLWRCIELPFGDRLYLFRLCGILSYVYHCLDIGVVGSLYSILFVLIVFVRCFILTTPLSICVCARACAGMLVCFVWCILCLNSGLSKGVSGVSENWSSFSHNLYFNTATSYSTHQELQAPKLIIGINSPLSTVICIILVHEKKRITVRKK